MPKATKDLITMVGGSQRRLCRILDMNEPHLSRVVNGRRPEPALFPVIAELLEALPRKDWPKRWLDS